MFAGIFRVAGGMRTAQGRDRTPGAKKVTEGISGQSRIGERANKDEIEVRWQFIQEILEARVANERNLVSFGFAPCSNYLRHDACEIGVHHSRIQGFDRSFGDQVDHSDSKPTHKSPDAAISVSTR